MDKVWEILKKIVIILIIVYFLALILETNFLIDLLETKPKFDVSRYFYKLLNLE